MGSWVSPPSVRPAVIPLQRPLQPHRISHFPLGVAASPGAGHLGCSAALSNTTKNVLEGKPVCTSSVFPLGVEFLVQRMGMYVLKKTSETYCRIIP